MVRIYGVTVEDEKSRWLEQSVEEVGFEPGLKEWGDMDDGSRESACAGQV